MYSLESLATVVVLIATLGWSMARKIWLVKIVTAIPRLAVSPRVDLCRRTPIPRKTHTETQNSNTKKFCSVFHDTTMSKSFKEEHPLGEWDPHLVNLLDVNVAMRWSGLSLDLQWLMGWYRCQRMNLFMDVIPIPCAESLCMVELTPGVKLYVFSSSFLWQRFPWLWVLSAWYVSKFCRSFQVLQQWTNSLCCRQQRSASPRQSVSVPSIPIVYPWFVKRLIVQISQTLIKRYVRLDIERSISMSFFGCSMADALLSRNIWYLQTWQWVSFITLFVSASS